MQCVILAGGLGTRMRPATDEIPKSLLDVAGHPFVAWQLERLARGGVTDVVFCTGHLGDQLEKFVGDGGQWRVSARYSPDGATLLGTGGALRLAHDRGLLAEEFLVTYGDSYLSVEPGALMAQLAHVRNPVVMSVWHNAGSVVPSNATFDGTTVTYTKSRPPADFEWVDYGMLAVERTVLEAEIPTGTVVDLAEVLEGLSRSGRLGGFAVTERCYEIGSPEGLAALELLLRDGTEYHVSGGPPYDVASQIPHHLATVRRVDGETPT